MLEVATDAISKNLIVLQIFLKKVLKLILYHYVIGFRAIYILMSLLNY